MSESLIKLFCKQAYGSSGQDLNLITFSDQLFPIFPWRVEDQDDLCMPSWKHGCGCSGNLEDCDLLSFDSNTKLLWQGEHVTFGIFHVNFSHKLIFIYV